MGTQVLEQQEAESSQVDAKPHYLDHVPKNIRKALEASHRNRPLAKPGALQAVLDAYELGEPITHIAKRLGISDQAVYRAILQNIPDQWQAYQSAKAISDLDKASDALDASKDNVAVSRTREQIKLAQWKLERTARSIYGDRQEVTVNAENMADLLLAVSTKMLKEKQINSLPNRSDQKDDE